MADSLQKIDRLIEGQGKILDFAVNTNAEVQEIKQQLADLSERTDRQFVDLSARTEQQLAGLSERTDRQFVDLSSRTEQQITDLAALTQKQIDELKTGQEALKVGQDLILQLLREKLG